MSDWILSTSLPFSLYHLCCLQKLISMPSSANLLSQQRAQEALERRQRQADEEEAHIREMAAQLIGREETAGSLAASRITTKQKQEEQAAKRAVLFGIKCIVYIRCVWMVFG